MVKCFSHRLFEFRKVLSDISEGKALSSLSSAGSSDADLFGSFVRVPGGNNQASMPFSKVTSNIATVLLRLLFRIPYFQSSDLKPTRDRDTSDILRSSKGQSFLALVPSFIEES